MQAGGPFKRAFRIALISGLIVASGKAALSIAFWAAYVQSWSSDKSYLNHLVEIIKDEFASPVFTSLIPKDFAIVFSPIFVVLGTLLYFLSLEA